MASIAPARNPDKLDPAIIRLSIVLMAGVLAVVFDTTIVSVALRTLASDMHVSVSTIQWVTTGYLLTLGMAIPVTGWLVDRYGGKNVWLAALAVFFLGSVGSSLAWNAGSLIGFRIIQGIGGGIMLPVMQTLIVQAAGGRNLGRVTSVIAMPAMLGPVLGPVLGGLIVNDFSWRWIFWVNVPFCVVGLILAWRMMEPTSGDPTKKLDMLGVGLISPGIALLLYGLSRTGNVGGFSDWTVLLPLIAGAILTAAFVVHALRVPKPLLDLRLFLGSTFSLASSLMFLAGFAIYGAMLVVPLYFQELRGHDPLRAGLLLAPQGIGIFASRTLTARLTDTIGPRWIVAVGLTIMTIGTIPFALAGPATSEWVLMAALVVRGCGLGAVMIPLVAASYVGLERAQIPDASIITRTLQQIGGAFGSAILAVILQNQLSGHAPEHAAKAYDATFWWTVTFAAIAVVIALFLPAHLPGQRQQQAPAPQAAMASE